MKTLTTLAATLLISTSAFAGTQIIHSDKNFNTEYFADKTAAYDAGFDYIDSLNDLSNSALKHKLAIITQNQVKDLNIDDSEVMIEEVAKKRGEVAYRAIINVDYHFSTYDNKK
ncbi:DUF3316 domain-containing protein [Psychromonas aquatilis]|uniref:DUF3316 domain-containing protein n=1 Tax=Psychromonas aquatilis TaxID=2005072 RepID=A0ABU9GNK3_9GAMM